MPKLGLGSSLNRAGLVTPGIVTDSLVLKHNYAAGGVTPVSDGACKFNVSSDYINCGNDSSLNMGASAYSVSCWVYFKSLGAVDDFVSMGSSQTTADGWALSKSVTNRIYFDIGNGTTRDETYSTTGILSANTWLHIAATKPAGGDEGRKIYLNGVDVTASEQHAVVTATDSEAGINFEIGSSAAHRYLDGYMCNVGVWTRELTQAQIKSIIWKNYAGLTSSETTNLVSWWNLSANANDDHGSNNGTLS